jgi:hypothetical protein
LCAKWDVNGRTARSDGRFRRTVQSRGAFVLGTSVFGFVFIVRRPEFQVPTSRYVVLVIGFFALFCYNRSWSNWEEH